MIEQETFCKVRTNFYHNDVMCERLCDRSVEETFVSTERCQGNKSLLLPASSGARPGTGVGSGHTSDMAGEIV